MRIAVCDDNPKELERIKGCFCRIQGYDFHCYGDTENREQSV